MVAVTIEDTAGNGITRGDDLDDTTGITLSNTWAGTSYGGTGAGANALAHYQPTAAVGRKIGSTGGFGYNVTIGTARDITTATYRVMMFKLLWLSYAGGNTAGMRVAWGSDDSNQHWVTVGDVGQIDAPDFRYPFAGGWVIKPVDMTLNAYIAATVGTPTNTAVDTFGPWADNSSTAGSGYDLWIDALDFVETGFYATGGTGADTPVQFQDFVDEDEGEGSTNFDRVGLWQSRSQIFFFYGKHTIGTNYAGTASATDFNDSFKTVVCPGGFVREGFNALVFDITTLANVQLLTSINISGTGRSGKKYFFDATSTTSNGEVNTTTNQITITGHDLRSGEQVLYDREGNTGYVTGAAGNGDSQLVTGSSGEYYYVINVDANHIQLAANLINSVGTTTTAITLTAQAGEIHSITRTPDARPDITIQSDASSGSWDFVNGNLVSCRHITLATNAEISGSGIVSSGKLFLNAGTLDGNSISNPTTEPGEGFIECTDAQLPNITNCTFTAGSNHKGSGHAIEITSSTASSTRSFSGNTFSDYASYSGTDYEFDGSSASVVNTTSNEITISNHPYVDGELVFYEDNGGGPIGGLTDGQMYYIGSTSTNTVALYNTETDATGDTNRISLTSVGTGTTHRFDSANAAIWNNTSNSWTLSVTNGGSSPSIRNTGTGKVTVTNNVTLTFTPLISGSDISVFAAGSNTPISATDSSGTSFNVDVGSGVAIDYKIYKKGYLPVEVYNVSFTATQNVLVNQQIDPNYDEVD